MLVMRLVMPIMFVVVVLLPICLFMLMHTLYSITPFRHAGACAARLVMLCFLYGLRGGIRRVHHVRRGQLFSTLRRVICRFCRRTGRRARPTPLGVGDVGLGEGEELSCGGVVL